VTGTALSAEVLLDMAAIRAVEGDWRALAERGGSPFDTPEWYEAVLRTRWGSERPVVVVVRDAAGALAGVLPLVRTRRRGARVLRFAGDDLGDAFGLLLAGTAPADDVAAAAAGALRGDGCPAWDAVALFGLEGDGWVPAFATALGGAVMDRGDLVRPRVEVPEGGWEAYLMSLKRTDRKEARRLRRRIAEVEGSRWSRTGDPGRAAGDMQRMFELHDARWEGRGGSSLSSPERRAILLDFATSSCARGWLRLWTLHVGRAAVACELAWRVGDRQTHYQGGFDEAYARLGVGIAAFAHAMDDAMASGATDIDLGQGTADYKLRFATGERRSRRLLITPRRSPARPAVAAALAARRAAVALRDSGAPDRLRGALRRVGRRGEGAEGAEQDGGDAGP
jgi:CelD/BcsL family acetyltransferase involved in cellulose biosynthesis